MQRAVCLAIVLTACGGEPVGDKSAVEMGLPGPPGPQGERGPAGPTGGFELVDAEGRVLGNVLSTEENLAWAMYVDAEGSIWKRATGTATSEWKGVLTFESADCSGAPYLSSLSTQLANPKARFSLYWGSEVVRQTGKQLAINANSHKGYYGCEAKAEIVNAFPVEIVATPPDPPAPLTIRPAK